MTLSDPRRALLPLALALACATTAMPVLAQGLQTSFEPGEPAPTQAAGALQVAIGNGPAAPYTAKRNAGYSGLHALHYSSEGGSARRELFRTDLPIEADTTLSWLVLPEIVGGDSVASTYVSLDLLLDDGSRVSAGAARDQHGVAIGARAQGESKTLYPQQWARRAVRLGEVPALKGRRVVAIELEVASAEGAPVSGWIDDVRLDAVPRQQPQRVSDWVLTTRGTQANGTFSRGNNFPATAVPHGFNFWTPVTDAGALNWLYRWNEQNDAQNRPQLQALALSHQPSPWMGDRQTFQVMPSASRGVPDADRRKRALSFDRRHESARPYRYDVRFDNGIAAAIAPTDHAALFRFEFPEGGDANLLFDNVDARGGLSLDPATQTLSGYTDTRSGLSNGASRMYVVASFDRPWRSSGRIDTGRPTGYIKFDAGSDRRVTMRIATSLISVEQARHNLALEIASTDTLESVAGRAQDAWDARLARFDIGDASDDQKTTLYSSLYRLYLYPNSGHENAGSAAAPDWRYANQASASDDNTEGSANRSFTGVRDGKVFVNNGFWDTFRTTWPAYALFTPDDAGQMVQGFIEQYRAGGWIARWSSPGYADLMVGTSSDVAFADAWLKGIGGFDPAEAYAAALKTRPWSRPIAMSAARAWIVRPSVATPARTCTKACRGRWKARSMTSVSPTWPMRWPGAWPRRPHASATAPRLSTSAIAPPATRRCSIRPPASSRAATPMAGGAWTPRTTTRACGAMTTPNPTAGPSPSPPPTMAKAWPRCTVAATSWRRSWIPSLPRRKPPTPRSPGPTAAPSMR